jgi:hypothetical protein
MYNMEVSIGSYKFRLEILILIVVVSWIMFGHLLCSCSTVSFKEAMATMDSVATGITTEINNATEKKPKKEGFVNANNVASGPEFSGAKTPSFFMDPSTWSMPNLTYSPGATPSAGVKAIWDRPKQPIPLPKDELDIFATTQFKPECCPNAYSNSTGCACMTVDQYSYLTSRGGNNVPYSEY